MSEIRDEPPNKAKGNRGDECWCKEKSAVPTILFSIPSFEEDYAQTNDENCPEDCKNHKCLPSLQRDDRGGYDRRSCAHQLHEIPVSKQLVVVGRASRAQFIQEDVLQARSQQLGYESGDEGREFINGCELLNRSLHTR